LVKETNKALKGYEVSEGIPPTMEWVGSWSNIIGDVLGHGIPDSSLCKIWPSFVSVSTLGEVF